MDFLTRRVVSFYRWLGDFAARLGFIERCIFVVFYAACISTICGFLVWIFGDNQFAFGRAKTSVDWVRIIVVDCLVGLPLTVFFGFGFLRVIGEQWKAQREAKASLALAGSSPPKAAQLSLEDRLSALIMEHDYAIPPQPVFQLVLSVGNQLLAVPRQVPVQEYPDEAQMPDQNVATDTALVVESVIACLGAYLSKLPRFNSAPFTRVFLPSGSLVYDMMQPLRKANIKSVVDRFNANTGAYTSSVKGAVETLWPHRFQGPPEQLAETYLRGTPLLPLFQVLVPYQPFTDEMRFTHHWCLGHNGTGKTTYLRHFIKDDLERVGKGEVSLVVMDSKKLMREMRGLKDFAAGEKLDGRLTLIDADEKFPLNPFHLPKRQAVAVLSYMLAGLSDASKLQTGVLRWYAEAAFHSSDKSLRTILKLMRLGDKDPLPEASRMPREVAEWFATTRKGVHTMTSGGIEQRLADFLRDYKDTLVPMLEADSWGLDFDDIHKGGHVLLVDTNRNRFGKDGANLLGRLVIALIDSLSSRRTEMDEAALKPVFVYIDEAQDYIQQDEIFADILEKARAQKIGVTVAHHHKGQIDKRVEQSLENSGIKSECLDKGSVAITTRRDHFTLHGDKLDFDRDDLQMGKDGYQKLRQQLRERFPYKQTRRGDIQEPPEYK